MSSALEQAQQIRASREIRELKINGLSHSKINQESKTPNIIQG